MADCECQCAGGAPFGWRKIPGGGRGLPFGPPFGFGGGFGASSSNNNNNNNNNNNSSSNNASNGIASALGGLLGLNGPGGLGGCGLPFGGPGPAGFGSLPFGGCGPGFFPQDCCCGPCCCGQCPPCSPSGCQPCGSVRWKNFKLVSPNGQECCFPVAVPWWCCDDGPTGPTGAAAAPAQATGQAPRDKPGCMSASQLLMQRYMTASPPRDYGKNAGGCNGRAAEPEIIDCPACEDDASPRFTEAMEDFRRSAVLIPSEASV